MSGVVIQTQKVRNEVTVTQAPELGVARDDVDQDFFQVEERLIKINGNQADEVEVFGLFGGDLPVKHQSRKPDCGKWIGDCPHNAPVQVQELN